MSRSTLIGFVIALACGIGLGLLIGWVISPTEYTDTAPYSLHPTTKADYAVMIATLYAQEGDLAAAQARLAPLGEAPGPLVAAAFEAAQTAQAAPTDLRHLAQLGAALGQVSPAMQVYLDP